MKLLTYKPSPCPFCGATYAQAVWNSKGGVRLVCPMCDAQTGLYGVLWLAQQAWERRPQYWQEAIKRRPYENRRVLHKGSS